MNALDRNRLLPTLLLGLALACAGAQAREDDPRIRQAREDLDASKALLLQATNTAEKALWQERVSWAEKELENTRHLVALEQQEKSFASKRKARAQFALRDLLGTVDTNTSEAERDLKNLKSKIQRLRADRAELERPNKKKDEKEDTDEDSKARAQREAKIRNLDAELLATTYLRDAAELQLRLASEGERVDALSKTNALLARPTIPLILQKRQNLYDVTKMRDEYQILRRTVEAQRKDTLAGRKLAEERFRRLDQEISLLRDGYKNARKSRSAEERDASEQRQLLLRRRLDIAESEKDVMEERLKHLQAQCDALDKSLMIAAQATDLAEAETAFLEEDLFSTKMRYVRRILGPLFLIAFLSLLYWGLSRYAFPVFFAKDHLFVAHRMGRYILFMLIILVLVSFFLEDLRAIATVLGIVGAAIVIALQDLCSAFAGWFVIVASGKVKVGDRIEVDGHRGDVIDMQLLRTTLVEVNNWLGVDEPTGRIVIIPNSFIFKSTVFNYSHVHRYIWDKVDITVTYETPVRDAYRALERSLREATRDEHEGATRGEELMEKRYGLRHGMGDPRIDTFIVDFGVLFRLIYPTHYEHACATRNRLMNRIIEEFARDTRLEFAYPTRRQISATGYPPKPLTLETGPEPAG